MKIALSIEAIPRQDASYVLQCQGYPLLDRIGIYNSGDTLKDLILQIHSTSDALIPFEITLNQLEADTITVIDQVQQLQLNPTYLNTIFHKLSTEMVISIFKDGQLIYSQAVQFDVMPLREVPSPSPILCDSDVNGTTSNPSSKCFPQGKTMRFDFRSEKQVKLA